MKSRAWSGATRGRWRPPRRSAVDLGASPLSILVDQREQKVLLQALRRIPLTSQVILELYFWERVTGAELGTLLGVVEDTARSRLRKAKQQLFESSVQPGGGS